MQFISEEDMNKFNELGYTFSSKYTPNNIGSTYHVIVTDKEGNEVVHTQSSYGNGSGHGYAMSFAQGDAISQLKSIIDGTEEKKEEPDWDFLNTLANWGYIQDYGYDRNGDLTILFDTWEQLEGREVREWNKETERMEETGEFTQSVFAKLVNLAEKGLLKPSINYTLTHFDSAFTDEYMRCDDCGRILNITWDGIRYVEEVDEVLCDDCINKNENCIEALINEARDDFKKALPVGILEEKLEEMGYEKIDSIDFSTRAEQWGEYSYGSHNIHHAIMEELCQKYNGFPKLTWVGQFDAEYNCLFPSETIEEARAEFKTITGVGV